MNTRKGITITEVLVAISVASVLMAILVPAVMSVREQSRKATCKNNMRQLGIGLQLYLASFGQFPKTARAGMGPSHVHLLPHLDQARTYATYISNTRPWTVEEAKNIPRVTTFVCPSDLNGSRPKALSYAENRGHAEGKGERMTLAAWPIHNGVFQHSRCSFVLRPAVIRDGQANTAAYAELLSLPKPRRVLFVAAPHDRAQRASASDLIHHCLTVATIGNPGVLRGDNWMSSLLPGSGYVHLLPPNGKSCVFQPGAGSDHVGGAHVTFCDGSLKFFANEVDTRVWIAMGTFAGVDEF